MQKKETTEQRGAPAPRRGERRLRVAALLAAPLLSLLVAEGALRWFLFSDASLARSLGAPLRDAGYYQSPGFDDDYWKLDCLWGDQDPTRSHPNFHADMGWVSDRIDPATLRHLEEDTLRGRRPLLLYGSSFIACEAPHETCVEGLFQGTGSAAELGLLNYACRGYGLDQTLMLLQRTLPLYAELDPLVVVNVVVPSDLFRTAMTVFTWPKPRYEVAGESLRFRPPARDLAELLEADPIGVRSYLWSHFVHRPGFLPADWQDRLTDHPKVRWELDFANLVMLQTMREMFASSEIEYFMLLFLHQNVHDGVTYDIALASEPLAVLRALGIPFVTDSREVVATVESGAMEVEDLFEQEGEWRFHPLPAGHAVHLETLERGLRGDLD